MPCTDAGVSYKTCQYAAPDVLGRLRGAYNLAGRDAVAFLKPSDPSAPSRRTR